MTKANENKTIGVDVW